MSGLVDFHVHSCYSSDADFSPTELVAMAVQSGFRAMSIADHDTVGAYPEAVECGRRAGLEIIPGIELTTLFDTREFHLLLPFVDVESPALARILDKVGAIRLNEARERVERLVGLGFPIAWDEVRARFGDNLPLGVSIAQMLLAKDEAKDVPRLAHYLEPGNRDKSPYLFYRDFFMEGKPAYVPKKHVDLLEILAAAPETGGVPTLSHPGAYFQQTTRDDLAVLKAAGLRGLEVYTTYHDPEQVSCYLGLAQEFGLVPTAGSDFHGKIKPHISFGAIRDGRYWMVERLRDGRGA
jgi:predicted metal-dependent phosphoesterase TrpH